MNPYNPVRKAHTIKAIPRNYTKAALGLGIINFPFKYRYQKGMGIFADRLMRAQLSLIL
jgi:hypothetical protein